MIGRAKLKQNTPSGFTIVELIIVVVVIAILAAIAIVSYNGIQNRARQARIDSNVSALLKKVEMYRTVNGVYPSAAGSYQQANFGSSDPTTSLPSNLYAVYVYYADVIDYNSIVGPGALDPSAGYVIKPCTSTGYTGVTVYYPDVTTSTIKSKSIGVC